MLATKSGIESAREIETKRQISETLKSKIEKAIDRESSLLKKVEELQSSFGCSSEREMTLVRQVRELKLNREEDIKRENILNATIEKLQESETIIKKQMEHSLGHVSILRKQIAEGEAKYNQILDEKINGGTTSFHSHTIEGKVPILERQNQSLITEVVKLKYQISCSKSRSFIDKDTKRDSKSVKEDSLSRATNLIIGGSGEIFNIW